MVSPFPRKPAPFIVTDPKTGRRFTLGIDVQIYRAAALDPRSDDEERAAEERGPMYRILYCTNTYDLAISHAKKLIARGHPEDRIEFVHADRDELAAFKRGEITISEMQPEEG